MKREMEEEVERKGKGKKRERMGKLEEEGLE